MAACKSALVVGGGIGGLSVAIALAQRGIHAQIVEQKTESSVYGVGIIQPSNQLRALAQIGLADQCIAQGVPFPSWRMCDPNGNMMVEVTTPQAAPESMTKNAARQRRDGA